MNNAGLIATKIHGVKIQPLKAHHDERGWLMELFRDDERIENMRPVMGYLSTTFPGVARGPHEHHHQTDLFAFLFGEFELRLWENRSNFTKQDEIYVVGEREPVRVGVPPGVVHAYKNIGSKDAFVLNFPDQLYAGYGRSEPVDEIRYEDFSHPRFKF